MLGKEILGYHVDEKIGSGVFGTVYKVSKTNVTGTYVRTLKHIEIPTKRQYVNILNSMGGDITKADDYFVNILKNIVGEIKILSALSESGNQNIVRYYENDVIETSSPKKYDIYILMEYLTPFPECLDNTSLTVKDVIKLGKDILNALIACHSRNIIHRDIKDDNIFVSSDGTYKIGDFGVSKALKDQSRAASIKGTPNFIAPEVYLGKENYDHTVDIYSLGIVLYRLLNNLRNPFLPMFPNAYTSEDEDAAFEARMTGKIPELPNMAKNELGEAILKAIKPRNERYDTAKEFLDALENAEKTLAPAYLTQGIGLLNASQDNEETVSASNSDATVAIFASVPSEEQKSNDDTGLFKTIGLFDEEQEIDFDKAVAIDSVGEQKNDLDEIVIIENNTVESDLQNVKSNNSAEETSKVPTDRQLKNLDESDDNFNKKKRKKTAIIAIVTIAILVALIVGSVLALKFGLFDVSHNDSDDDVNNGINTGIPIHTHTGGIKNCEETAVCTICGESYKHTQEITHSGSIVWMQTENLHEAKYSCCNKTSVAKNGHSWDNGNCLVCGYTCNHLDLNKDHKCDRCSYKTSHSYKDGKCTFCGEIEWKYLRSENKILFGSYPQTEVTDFTLKTKLDAKTGSLPTSNNPYDWTSYRYYIDGKANDFMWYIDIIEDGEKYRGVYFTSNRLKNGNSNESLDSVQYNNGYVTRTIYWFKYEPISWTILSEDIANGTALILCDMIIDAQAYQDKDFYDSNLNVWYNSSAGVPEGVYANNYEHSTVRKWLNNQFLNTAFTDLQKEIILITTVDNSLAGIDGGESCGYASSNTQDKIFLPSGVELCFSEYGFSLNCNDMDDARKKQATDYAKAQGSSDWWSTRTPNPNNLSCHIIEISNNGNMGFDCYVGNSSSGIVPTLQIDLSDKESDISLYSEGLKYSQNDDGTYTVSGVGNCKDTEIFIPSTYQGLPVTRIGGGAFFNCKSLTSVIIPDSVTSIGNSAFSDCTGLTSVTIPNSVKSIGYRVFYDCSSLTSVTIPDSVTSIGDLAFDGCSGLTSVTIPDSVTSIGDYLFSECTSLTNVTIPDSVTSIGQWAFSGCTGLTSVTIPDSVTSIGDRAFSKCTSLTNVAIPDSVTSIGDYLFSECTRLTNVTIPDSVTSIGDSAFEVCRGLTSVTIPDSVTSIGWYAFKDCTRLTSVTIGNSVTSIGYYAFYGCTGLTNVTIPDSVTSIGDGAFSKCISLTNVTIPDSVTSIGDYAFDYCTGLTSVTIPDSVTSIGYSAFDDCDSLTSVKFTNADGWKADDINLSSSELSNPSTAAQYLRKTYYNSTWIRS